jgi:hypothetical protein
LRDDAGGRDDQATARVRAVLAQRLRDELTQAREVLAPDEVFPPDTLVRVGNALAWTPASHEGAAWPSRAGDAFPWLDTNGAALAAANERAMTRALETLVEPAAHRSAVLERAAGTWPWLLSWGGGEPEPPPTAEARGQLSWLLYGVRFLALSKRLHASDVAEALLPWSADIAPREVIAWVAAGLERTRRGQGKPYVEACDRLARERKRDLKPEPATVPDGLLLHGQHLACLCAAAKAVERDRHVPAFKVSATRPSSAAMAMLAAGPPKRARDPAPWTKAELTPKGDVVLSWDGRRQPMQLVLLPDEGESLDVELTKIILTELGEDGLRDWLVLHRMASDQGGTGAFRWSWDEHRQKTNYLTRLAHKNATEADLARGVRQRLGRLKRAEIWLEARRDDQLVRRRVGPFGLIDIEAELFKDHGQTPMVVSGRLNPEIYRGARGSVFTLVPEAILARPIAEVRLLTLASFPWRAGDEKGVATLRAKTLWDYAGLRAGKYTDARRFTDARRALERLLQNLEKHAGVTFAGGGDGPDAVYRLTAPTWWRDRVVHGVGPVLASKATLAVPRTGAELAALRKAKALTARAVAEVLGVNHSTVLRAESKPSAPLPPEWLPRLAAAAFTLERGLLPKG